MKIAFTTKGIEWESLMDPRFGRTEYILTYDEETKILSSVDNTDIEGVAHGAGTKTARVLFDIKPDVLITGNGPGENAAVVLKQFPLKIYIGAGGMTIKAAYDAYLKQELKEF